LKQKCKNRFFRAYLRQKWINLRQTKTEMIKGQFITHIDEYISSTEMLHFCDLW